MAIHDAGFVSFHALTCRDAACNNEAPRASRAPATRKEPKEQEVIERKSLRSRSQVVSYRDSARFSYYDEEKPKRSKAASIGRARAPRQPGTSGGSGAYTTEAVSKMPGVWHPCLYGASLEASRLAQAAAEEHRQALLQAGSSCSDIKVLSHSQVEEGFWLHLPSPWWRKHQHLSRTWVCLVCSDKWPSADYRLTASEQSSSGSGSDEDGKPSAIVGDWWWVCVPVEHTKSGGLSGGWRSFSIDHDLTIGDCIWFEDLGSRTWKVHIFRAGDFQHYVDSGREPPEGLDEPSVEGWADTAALCDLRSLPKQQPRWGRQGDIASAGNLVKERVSRKRAGAEPKAKRQATATKRTKGHEMKKEEATSDEEEEQEEQQQEEEEQQQQVKVEQQEEDEEEQQGTGEAGGVEPRQQQHAASKDTSVMAGSRRLRGTPARLQHMSPKVKASRGRSKGKTSTSAVSTPSPPSSPALARGTSSPPEDALEAPQADTQAKSEVEAAGKQGTGRRPRGQPCKANNIAEEVPAASKHKKGWSNAATRPGRSRAKLVQSENDLVQLRDVTGREPWNDVEKNDNEDVCIVYYIRDYRVVGEDEFFLVSWYGYTWREDLWVMRENLSAEPHTFAWVLPLPANILQQRQQWLSELGNGAEEAEELDKEEQVGREHLAQQAAVCVAYHASKGRTREAYDQWALLQALRA
ncbi:hypothetical protein V8C86DRAFT_2979530 [Haematococcus lacustris]